ncbi:KGGVGR-motif variant AAA ATPase [Archangium sp.]|uniref:MinD/ParA family ATP-binding protein n=1 Tax=Archangium sp. TaxID=1872627 RepID=UPI00286B0620|nr:P-loop NTPase [Archangium sp.]
MSALWTAFYSVRGGVGRSTSLVLIALELARRGHRVAVLDFDLESPGLDVLLTRDKARSQERIQQPGVVDFLDARARGETFRVEDIIIPLELPGDYTGRLFVVPAGRCDDAYLAALDRLDLKQMYERSGLLNPVRQLRAELEEALEPDVVLIDSRTGYSDAALVTLFDLADAAVIVMVPDLQNVERLAPVLRRLVRAPKPQLLLVANKCQSTPPAWRAVANVEARLRELVPGAEEDVDEVESPFLHKLPFLSEFTWVQRLLPPPVPSDALRLLASRLDALVQERASPPAPTPRPPLSHGSLAQRQEVLERLHFGSPSAEEDDRLLDTFVPTRNVREALKPERWLVRGARGSGRTALFRQLVERPLETSKYCPELAGWRIIPASRPVVWGRYPSKTSSQALLLKSAVDLAQKTSIAWEDVWRIHTVAQTMHSLPMLATTELRREAAALSNLPYTSWEDHLQKLLARGTRVWREEFNSLAPMDGAPGMMLVYDDADNPHEQFLSLFPRPDIDKQALIGLLNVWTTEDVLAKRNRIAPKILIREDIFNTIPSEVISQAWRLHDAQLRWELSEIATCVVGRARLDPKTSNYLEEQGGALRHFAPGEARDFAVLFDERVGAGDKRARTWQMAIKRLLDAEGRLFPMDFVQAAITAQRLEKQNPSSARFLEAALISGSNLLESFSEVSEFRARRIAKTIDQNEGEVPSLDGLRGLQSPFHEEELLSRLVASQQFTHSHDEKKATAQRVLLHLKRLGVIGEWADGRLFVAELYLHGLGMHRAGLKAPQDEAPSEPEVDSL